MSQEKMKEDEVEEEKIASDEYFIPDDPPMMI
jgi:hypothetical protein